MSDMNVRVISENEARHTAEVVIVSKGKSYTRHCKVVDEGYRGRLLEPDLIKLHIMELGSLNALVQQAESGKAHSIEVYKPNEFFTYSPHRDGYEKAVRGELQRAADILFRQGVITVRQLERLS